MKVRRASSGSGSSAQSDGDGEDEGAGRENAADDSGIGSSSRRMRSRETREGFLLVHMVRLRMLFFSYNWSSKL